MYKIYDVKAYFATCTSAVSLFPNRTLRTPYFTKKARLLARLETPILKIPVNIPLPAFVSPE
jgi:hypothetical protein